MSTLFKGIRKQSVSWKKSDLLLGGLVQWVEEKDALFLSHLNTEISSKRAWLFNIA